MANSQDKEVILAKGSPPLTQLMVNRVMSFFEWVLDIRLSPEQASQVQQLTVRSWKTNKEDEIKGALHVIDVYEQVAPLSESEHNNVKEKLQGPLLENIHSNPDDELSKILLSVYQVS